VFLTIVVTDAHDRPAHWQHQVEGESAV